MIILLIFYVFYPVVGRIILVNSIAEAYPFEEFLGFMKVLSPNSSKFIV